METLTMNDGTVLEDSHVILNNGLLSFYVQNGMTLPEVYVIFSDPQKTAKITAFRFGAERVYEGYTDLNFIQKSESQISGGLTQV